MMMMGIGDRGEEGLKSDRNSDRTSSSELSLKGVGVEDELRMMVAVAGAVGGVGVSGG